MFKRSNFNADLPTSHGIGYATVKHLVLRGATVYLGARNEAKANEAVKSLEHEVAAAHAKSAQPVPSPGKIVYHHCDLSTPAQAKESGEKFIERESRLDVLSKFNPGLHVSC